MDFGGVVVVVDIVDVVEGVVVVADVGDVVDVIVVSAPTSLVLVKSAGRAEISQTSARSTPLPCGALGYIGWDWGISFQF